MSTIQFTDPTTPNSAKQEALQARANKRRRVNLACERCRTRKSRCDGRQPTCENCEKAKAECIYREPAWQSRTQEDFELEREDLELDQNERRSQRRNSSVVERLQAVEERLRRVEGEQPMNALSPLDGEVEESTPATRGQGHGLTTDDISPGAVDAMGTVSFADEQDSAFFGPSSNIAFLGHISKAIESTRDQASSARQSEIESDAAILHSSRPSRHVSPRNAPISNFMDEFTLPPEDELLELAREYFGNTGFLFPYIHEESFYETYSKFKPKNPRNVCLSWLALCNMLLANAVSSKMDDSLSISERVKKAEMFFKRGVTLSRKVDEHGTSLEEVQYLLLATQYLQGTQRSVQTYACHGRAVRAAYSLGLHSSDALRRFSPLEQEMRKRIWYVCVLADRNLSMTFGRPPSIPDSFVRLPLPNPLHSTNPLDLKAPHQPSAFESLSLNFFNASIELYKIMSRIIEVMYGQNLGCSESENIAVLLAHIPSFEVSLSRWIEKSRDITKDIRPRSNEKADFDAASSRLETILALRFLNLRTLLHRPVLQNLLDSRYDPGQRDADLPWHLMRYIWNSAESCFASARNVIEIIHVNKHKKRGLGAWWYSLYYTFNSALVVLAVHLVSHAPSTERFVQGAEEVPRILDMAIETLSFIDVGNQMVERCRIYLQKLVQAYLSGTPSTHQTQGRSQAQNNVSTAVPEASHPFSSQAMTMNNSIATANPSMNGFNGENENTGFPSYNTFTGIGDLEMGPFMTNGSLDFLSFYDEQQMYRQ